MPKTSLMEQKLRRLNDSLSRAAHLFCNSDLRRLMEVRWGGIGSILMMHRVVEHKDDSAACGLSITTTFLDQALTVLRAAGVQFVTLKELHERLADGSTPRRAVALTFDDGYRDNLTLALPILRKHQAPATIFVPSGAPDRTMDVWFLRLDRAVMSSPSLSLGDYGIKEALPAETASDKAKTYRRLARFIHSDLRHNRTLAETLLPKRVVSDEALLDTYFASWSEWRVAAEDPLLTIGAHTVSHPVLGHLPEAEAQHELVEGRRRLSTELGRDINLLAYPYGGRHECGTREYRLAERSGFDLAVTTRYGGLHGYHECRPFELPRKTLGGDRESIRALVLDVLGSGSASASFNRQALASGLSSDGTKGQFTWHRGSHTDRSPRVGGVDGTEPSRPRRGSGVT